MKYFLLILFLLLIKFSEAQKKFKKFINEYDLNGKVSVHGTNLFSNSYTVDTFDLRTPTVGAPQIFLHYRHMPTIQVNYTLTGKVVFYKKRFFVESGIQLINNKYELRKVEGSHIPDSLVMVRSVFMGSPFSYSYWNNFESGVTNYHSLEIPILIGVNYKFLSLAVGTYRSVYEWSYSIRSFSDRESEVNFYSYFGRGGGKIPLNGMLNISANIIDHKFKLSPFVNFRGINFRPYWYSNIQAGIALGLRLKENKN